MDGVDCVQRRKKLGDLSFLFFFGSRFIFSEISFSLYPQMREIADGAGWFLS